MSPIFWTAIDWNVRSPVGRKVIGDCYDAHRWIMSGFPDVEGEARGSLGVLWRHDMHLGLRSLVQSRVAPDFVSLAESGATDAIATKEIPVGSMIEPNGVYRFETVVSPTRKIDTKTGADGRRRNGRRVPLRRPDDQLRWLDRRLSASGASLIKVGEVADAVAVELVRHEGWKRRNGSPGRQITHEGARFRGTLQVKDVESVTSMLENGLGPGKAFGFGLVTILRV